MKTLFLLFSLIVLPCTALAAAIDGPANMRDKPNGVVFLKLNDGFTVYPIGYRSGWYRVRVIVYVKPGDYVAGEGGGYIKAGAGIFDKEGNQKGKVIQNLRAFLSGRVNTGKKGLRPAVAYLYTYKDNVQEDSIVERDIERLLRENKYTRKDLEQHLDKFDYKRWRGFGDFNTAIHYHDDGSYDPSPGPRIILFFLKDRLFAILHTEEIESPKFVDSSYIWGYKIDYLKKIDKKLRFAFDDHYFEIIENAD